MEGPCLGAASGGGQPATPQHEFADVNASDPGGLDLDDNYLVQVEIQSQKSAHMTEGDLSQLLLLLLFVSV